MLGYLKTDAFERYHHTYPASYLWVFIDGKFVRELTEYGDVFLEARSSGYFYISFAFVNIIG